MGLLTNLELNAVYPNPKGLFSIYSEGKTGRKKRLFDGTWSYEISPPGLAQTQS